MGKEADGPCGHLQLSLVLELSHAAMSDDDLAGASSSSPLLFESSADDDEYRVALWGKKEHSDAAVAALRCS